MKKSQKKSMQNLGKKISEDEFLKDDSIHIFSVKYENDKKQFLNKIKLMDKIKKAKRKKMFIIAACVVIIFVPASVFAANKVISNFKVNKEQTNQYAYDYKFEGATEDASKSSLFHSYVKFQYGYLPQGYVESLGANDKRSNKFALNGSWYSNQNMTVVLKYVDDNKKLSFTNVLETKDITVGSNEASILYLNSTSASSYNKILLVFYNDYGYALQIYAQNDVPDEELIKVAQNLELVQCSESEAEVAFYPTETPTTAAMTAASTQTTSATPTTSQYSNAINESKFLNIGDVFAGLDFGNSNWDLHNFVYTIENVEIKDSIAGLDTAGFGFDYEDVLQVVDANGNLKPYVQKEIAKGDGKTSVDTVVGETTSDLKLIYVTIKLKNTTDNLIDHVQINPQLCCLKNNNGVICLPESTYTTEAVNSEGHAVYSDKLTMYADDPNTTESKQEAGQAYTIHPQEELEFHLAYVVQAENMNNMVLFFNPEGRIKTYPTAQQIIIKLY